MTIEEIVLSAFEPANQSGLSWCSQRYKGQWYNPKYGQGTIEQIINMLQEIDRNGRIHETGVSLDRMAEIRAGIKKAG